MKSRWKNRLTALVVASIMTTGSVAAYAAPPPDPAKLEEARQRYERGLKLFDDENYDAACIEFQRAYDLAPIYRILYNIGLCHRQKNDYVAALRTLEQYLQEGGGEIAEARRNEVAKIIGELRPRIAYVEVKTNVADAEILLDDVVIGKSPLSKPVMVNPGRRKFAATKAGRLPTTRSIEVAGSDHTSVELNLAEVPVRHDTVTVRENVAPYVAWTVTGALAVSAGITGFIAYRAYKKQDDLLTTPNANAQDLQDNRSKMRTWAVVADVLTVTTVAAAGVSLWVTLRPSKRATTDTGTANNLKLGVGVGTFSLQGAF